MFDIGASELLLIVVVAIVVIGPKDLPLAMRTAGRWIGKIRRVSNHFRSGLETMIREAELEEMEKKWQQQNKRIMEHSPPDTQSPADEMSAMAAGAALPPEMADASKPAPENPAASAEGGAARSRSDDPANKVSDEERDSPPAALPPER